MKLDARKSQYKLSWLGSMALAFLAVLLLSVWVAVIWGLYSLHQEAIRSQIQESSNISRVLQEQVTRVLEIIDKATLRRLQSIISNWKNALVTPEAARQLAAKAYEQLGYQMESATARNAFLQGASELRNGTPKLPSFLSSSPDVIRSLPLDMFFDYLGVRLNGDKAQGKSIVINWRFTDTAQDYALTLSNSALSHTTGVLAPNADATLTLARTTLDDISLQKTSFPKALLAGDIKISGNPLKVMELMGLLEDFTPGFPVVEPRPTR